MVNFVLKLLRCYRSMPLLMTLIAASALGMALLSQYVGGLHPCILCVWQRWPYGVVILLGIIGFIISFKSPKAVGGIMGLIGVTFLANSAIAFYHTGVELKWWKSIFQSCSVPPLEGDMDKILEDIKNRANAARCDEIPWADPILHLSMANYNVLFCLGLAVVAFMSALLIYVDTKKV